MPVTEECLYLPSDRYTIGQVPQYAQREFVFHGIADYAAVFFFQDAVTMVEVAKGPAPLLVAKEIVPAEFRDAGIPLQAPRNSWKGSKTDGDDGSFAGGNIGSVGSRRGDAMDPLQLCLLPRGHQRRKIGRVGEESEYLFLRVGKPLFGVEAVAHVVKLSQKKQAPGAPASEKQGWE